MRLGGGLGMRLWRTENEVMWRSGNDAGRSGNETVEVWE